MKNKLVMWDDLLLLDYIGDIEDRYIPEYDCFEYSDSVSLEICEVTDEDFSEEELEMLDSMPVGASRCKSIFTTRYNCDGDVSSIFDEIISILSCLNSTSIYLESV